MQLPFKRARWQQDSEGFWLSLLIADKGLFPAVRRFVDTLKDRPYIADIKEFRKKRSLDANAYFWELAGKLSSVLRISPKELYRQYIPDVGGNYEVIPVRESILEEWERIWSAGHDGRIVEDMGPCRNTPGYHNVRCYIGSSDYDTAQMSRLIDLIVSDCKDQDIETLPPDKLALLKDGWRNEVSKSTA